MHATSDDLTLDATILDEQRPPDMYCPACMTSFPTSVDYCPKDGTRLIKWQPRADPLVGVTLDGRYRIVDCLATGPIATIYRGVQVSVDRAVAIKILRLDTDIVGLGEQFKREREILTSLNHPNIVCILDSGELASGQQYVVTELFRGTTLEAELARTKRFSVRRTCEVALQLCSALAAAHSRGTVHRDLKPATILLLEDLAVRDVVKVLDFGLSAWSSLASDARITAAGVVIGTPQYMAPELFTGSQRVDASADLYSLGCVMYELLAGRPPFADYGDGSYWLRPVRDAPPTLPAHVPSSIATAVMELLADVPEHRPSAVRVREQLQSFLDAETTVSSTMDAETVVAEPIADGPSDLRPTLQVMPPLRTRVLPPTPLIAQPIPLTSLLTRPMSIHAVRRPRGTMQTVSALTTCKTAAAPVTQVMNQARAVLPTTTPTLLVVAAALVAVGTLLLIAVLFG